MNNSKIAIENTLREETLVDYTPMYRKQATELTEIIEAIEAVSQSNYWKLLQEKVFSGVLESLQHRIRDEKDSKNLFRLQGQIIWAEKYSDFKKMATVYRNQLENIKSKIKN